MTEDVKKADGTTPKKLSLQRRTKTTVSTTTGGKAKEVQVEVRKKRTVPTDAAQRAEEAKLKAIQEAERLAAEKAKKES
ncbi:translation initiation factor IF-2 [Pasteurella dagmatis ATCC 43325]|uniref:Translation initiation factor IF-2 n=1 Tax=Pasteurella dagmatis ATCC 43325 TaxID=667128 RepID=C9PRG6_9PAST|nr:translation initiation factor IF-2 [Pasteurella dagmatis ATCC 43325]